jgi:integrase
VLAQAVDDGLLIGNPVSRPGKYLRTADEPKHESDPLTREEAAHLLAVAERHFPEWHPWLLCALRTGMRIGELLALEWGDIDWRGPAPSILVQRAVVRGRVTTPKNHQRRKIDLSRRLRAALYLHRRRQRAKALKDGRPRPALVFPSDRAHFGSRDDRPEGVHLDVSNVRKVFLRMLDKAELRHRRIHDLRHTFASLLIQQGEPLAYVQKQMGHSSIMITVDVYGKWEPGGNREAVDRLDQPSALRRTG